MEEKIEADKKDIRKKFEKQRAKIEAQVEMAAEEKKKLIVELEEKEGKKQDEKKQASKALKRLNKM